eukprot:gene16514-18165_t
MSGKCSGAAAIIKSKFPKIPYVHCGSHLLNLCLASACQIQVVRNMMSHVRVVSEFFNNSPKRFKLLSDKIKELPNARHFRLIDVCRTRWVARLDGLDVFVEVLVAIVEPLELIKLNSDRSWNSDSVRDASGLFHATLNFQFIVVLTIVSRCLEKTRPLTKQLQAVSFDVVAVCDKITLLKSTLYNLRAGIGTSHHLWYDEAQSLAESIGAHPSLPRTVKRQQHRDNTPANSVSEYYERVVTLPFLDHVSGQIHFRFSEANVASFDGFYAFPTKVVTCVDWKEKVRNFLVLHSDDLPEPRYIDTELNMWEVFCYESEHSPSTLSELLPKVDRLTFLNLFSALQISATTPVTTCTCERSVSILRRLKTYLRNTISQSRLDGLALLHVHREIKIDVDVANTRLYQSANNGKIVQTPVYRMTATKSVTPYLVGDSEYPMHEWLIKPYQYAPNMNSEEKVFNLALSEVRVCIEKAFGILKGRWRILIGKVSLEPSYEADIVVACCVLHNICQDCNEPEEGVADQYDTDPSQVCLENICGSGETIRRLLHAHVNNL